MILLIASLRHEKDAKQTRVEMLQHRSKSTKEELEEHVAKAVGDDDEETVVDDMDWNGSSWIPSWKCGHNLPNKWILLECKISSRRTRTSDVPTMEPLKRPNGWPTLLQRHSAAMNKYRSINNLKHPLLLYTIKGKVSLKYNVQNRVPGPIVGECHLGNVLSSREWIAQPKYLLVCAFLSVCNF